MKKQRSIGFPFFSNCPKQGHYCISTCGYEVQIGMYYF